MKVNHGIVLSYTVRYKFTTNATMPIYRQQWIYINTNGAYNSSNGLPWTNRMRHSPRDPMVYSLKMREPSCFRPQIERSPREGRMMFYLYTAARRLIKVRGSSSLRGREVWSYVYAKLEQKPCMFPLSAQWNEIAVFWKTTCQHRVANAESQPFGRFKNWDQPSVVISYVRKVRI